MFELNSIPLIDEGRFASDDLSELSPTVVEYELIVLSKTEVSLLDCGERIKEPPSPNPEGAEKSHVNRMRLADPAPTY